MLQECYNIISGRCAGRRAAAAGRAAVVRDAVRRLPGGREGYTHTLTSFIIMIIIKAG